MPGIVSASVRAGIFRSNGMALNGINHADGNRHHDRAPAGGAATPLHWRLLLAGTLGPLTALVLLTAFDVPLGLPGKFVYPYSPVVGERLRALPWVLPVAAAIGLGAAWSQDSRRARRIGGQALFWTGCAAGGVWSFVAPPQFVSQHYFNMVSPSHDGAFLAEARKIARLGEYLRYFPERARTPREEMRGTRVISNPPGATVLAHGVLGLLAGRPELADALERAFVSAEVDDPRARRDVAEALAFALVLAALWLAAGPVIYLAARELLPDGAALLVAAGCLLTPATLSLSPGKDSAQLLPTAIGLWLWLRACRRQRAMLAALAGAAFAAAFLVSLAHVWVAVAACGATALHAFRRRALTPLLVRVAAPAASAGLLLCIVLLAWGMNALEIGRAVAAAQASVTRGPDAMPWYWQALGAPLFLLFAGPVLWTLALWAGFGRARDDAARLGGALLGLTGLILLGTVVFTNVETPRLWIPFMPLLLIGLALCTSSVRQGGPGASALIGVLLAVQVAASALSWSLMDMRETETRLVDGPEGGPRLFH
jgi:hypothetical protein